MKRRDFIKIVSLTGSGLILASFVPAVFLKGEGKSKGKFDDPGKGIFAPGPFLRIDSSGEVTIFVAKSEMGQGVFTSLPMIVAEELEVDWEKIKIVKADAGYDYGDQGTGGSSSVRDSYDPLRKAGATARIMLLTAAASLMKASVNDLYAENGSVINKKTGEKLGYGELAEVASKLPVPKDVPLKDPKDFKIIGKRKLRKDTPQKLFGEAIYGIDVKIPGMIYSTVKKPNVYGLKVKSFDKGSIKGFSGIFDVFEVASGVAVTGKSTWQVFKAVESLKAEWIETDTCKFDSDKLIAEAREKLNKPDGIIKKHGNPEKYLKPDQKLLTADYELPYLAHAPLETPNCTIEIKNGKCEVWACTQNPQDLRWQVSQKLGMKEVDVTVHLTFIGGAFGRRFVHDAALEAAEIAKKTGKPVKVTWTREEDMRHSNYRPLSVHRLSGVVKDDKIEMLNHQIVAQSIWAQFASKKLNPNEYDIAEGATEFAYTIPNYQVTGTLIKSPIAVGYWRSVFNSQNPFVVESFVDELAIANKIDPYLFRKKMMPSGSRPLAVLDLAAEKSGWGKKLEKGSGMGLSFFQGYDSFCAQVMEVTVKGNFVKVNKVTVVMDCGLIINPLGVETQLEGAIIFALSAALKGKITVKQGVIQQTNFDDYPIISFDESPVFDIHLIQNTNRVGGVGEVGVGGCAPALCNAIYSATGKRVRKLPIDLANS
jgi:isoquinoline 1-oxidoreductase beta subunit